MCSEMLKGYRELNLLHVHHQTLGAETIKNEICL